MTFSKLSLVVGGSGLTPAYQLIVRILKSQGDKTTIRVIDANKDEGSILLHEQLNELEKEHEGQVKITHVLSHPSNQPKEWKGLKGHVNADIIKNNLFPPAKDSGVFLCGPPAMIQKTALPALTLWGYVEEENAFGF